MQRLLVIAVFTLCFSISSVGQRAPEPAFSSYKVPVEKATAKSINFKNDSAARTFKTRLSEALKEGVNFAGHYIVAGWGCGTGCISGAIIDARTGNVVWPIELYSLGVWYEGNSYVDEPVAYRKNSRLLIISGSPGVLDGQKDKPNGKYFYEWRGNALHQIKFIPFKSAQ
jgi:hypothetical protein